LRSYQLLNRGKSYFRALLWGVGVLGYLSGSETSGKIIKNYEENIWPILESKCFKCHDEDVQKGDLRLDTYETYEDMVKDFHIWERVVEQVESEEMPPKKPFLEVSEETELLNWSKSMLDSIDWTHIKSPGYVVMSRLSNEEYNNTIRDLFGLDLQLANELGKDSQGMSGFDHDREGLSLSQTQIEKYLTLSNKVVAAFFKLDEKPEKWHYEAEEMLMTESRSAITKKDDFEGYILNRGQMTLYDTLSISTGGYYKFKVRAQSSNKKLGSGFTMRLDNEEKLTTNVQAGPPSVIESAILLNAGEHQMTFNILDGLGTDNLVPPKSVSQKSRAISNTIKLKLNKENVLGHEYEKELNKLYSLMEAHKHSQVFLEELDVTIYFADYKRRERTHSTRFKDIKKLIESLSKKMKLDRDVFINFVCPDFLAFEKRLVEKAPLMKEKKKLMGDYTSKSIGIDWISIEGPFLPEGMTRNSLLVDVANQKNLKPKVIKQKLKQFMTKAFRRPVLNHELNQYFTFYNQQKVKLGNSKSAIQQTIRGILTSPYFLMHHEREVVAKANQGDKDIPLSGYQLISRLSYFLWKSLPDQKLFELAASNEILNQAVLKSEVKRMLADPKAKTFISSFAEQWLGYGELGRQQMPDKKRFRNFSQTTVSDMREETSRFIWHIFKNDQPIRELITSEVSILNERLAEHYGIEEFKGKGFKLASLKGSGRSGILGMGSVLTATSSPLRTSPVNRGMWVLESVLGDHLPEPPADVEPLPENAGEEGGKSLREILSKHRENLACAKCHDKIDPIGFGLENFDAIGKFREEIAGIKIDNSGELSNNIKFNGLLGLRDYIVEHRLDDFNENFIKKLLSFALGRQLEHYDQATIKSLIEKNKQNKGHALQLLEEVVLSYPFLYMREKGSSI